MGSTPAGLKITTARCRSSLNVVASVTLVLLVILPYCVVGLEWRSDALQKQFTPRRALLDRQQIADQSQVIRAEIMHREHPSSPLSTAAYKTPRERFVAAVQRSHLRARAFAQHIEDAAVNVGASQFTSSVKSGVGEYLMNIAIGTPPQTFTTIMDTGSDLVWTQCDPCNECYPQKDAVFNPAASSTYQLLSCTSPLCLELPSTACTGANACEYGYGYGDGSITEGYFSSDSVSFPANVGTVPNIAFGCGVANEGNFGAADGLVGLGQGPVSLVSQLGNANIEPIFSYCLVGIYSTSTSPLLLGNASTDGVAFTPLVANPINPTFYYAGLTGITVNGVQIDYPADSFAVNATDGSGGLIVDSGTTLTYLVQEAYTPVLQAFEALVTYPRVDGSSIGLDLCVAPPGADAVYPNLVYQFANGSNLEVPGNNVFLLVDPPSNTTCLSLAGIEGFSILGNIHQQDHLMVFDLAAQQIGFKSDDCTTL
ncbi:hypothetical protein CY35_17G089600 [Sphagnum magellanicum]|jgi:hypothetical protein|nr:hypothetical protein CY35_17G089600 [Sphagnum magellanicum]